MKIKSQNKFDNSFNFKFLIFLRLKCVVTFCFSLRQKKLFDNNGWKEPVNLILSFLLQKIMQGITLKKTLSCSLWVHFVIWINNKPGNQSCLLESCFSAKSTTNRPLDRTYYIWPALFKWASKIWKAIR